MNGENLTDSKVKGAGSVSVLIVEDHPIVRAGVTELLQLHHSLVVVGQAADGFEGLERARELCPNLVIVDISLPKLDGLSLIRAIHRDLPHAKMVVLSMHAPEHMSQQALQAGAHGYVCKAAASTELVKALEIVAAGGTFFENGFSLGSKNHSLERDVEPGMSPREHDVLVGIAEGMTSKQIAVRLAIGVRTVQTHRDRLVRKLNIHSTAGLTRFAVQVGVVSLEDSRL
jgi:DNA-binding NarL/FixJ family response regulator